MRVLIHNSDSPFNQGDRAILGGIIELVRGRWPDAEIWALSQFAERDEEWFGIRFLPQSPYSLNPIDWWRLLRHARRSDLVLWGGGELLKDYTNRLSLYYWRFKLALLRRVTPTVVGAFQGIGPTTAPGSRRLIARTVDSTKQFLVRDAESREKLRAWGAKAPITASYDPAVIAPRSPWGAGLEARLRSEGVDPDRLGGSIGFGVRRWFHYQRGGLLPQRFRRGAVEESPRLTAYRRNLAALADRLVTELDRDVCFFSMHTQESESDAGFAREVIALMQHPERAVVIEATSLSAADYGAIMARLDVLVAARLHSAIIASSVGLPAFALYYVDKGRLFFEQLGCAENSAPIERLLDTDAVDALSSAVVALSRDRAAASARVAQAIAVMADQLRADFAGIEV